MPLATKASATYTGEYNARRLILLTGGAVAKLLLQHRDQYHVRCLTRNIRSSVAEKLAAHGAELVQGDLRERNSLKAAVDGCWGVFAVTNYYDSVYRSLLLW